MHTLLIGAGLSGIATWSMSDDTSVRLISTVPELAHYHFGVDIERRRVYACTDDGEGGTILIWSVAPDGVLDLLGRVRSDQGLPCFASVHPAGTHLVVVNYRGGSVSIYRILESAPFLLRTDVIALPAPLERPGAHPVRQDRSHPHSVAWYPDGSGLVADLGADALIRLTIDETTGRGTLGDVTRLPAGSGPRDVLLDANGTCWVVAELSGALYACTGNDDPVVIQPAPDVDQSVDPSYPAGLAFSDHLGSVISLVRVPGLLIIASSRDPARWRAFEAGGEWPVHTSVHRNLVVVANRNSDRLDIFVSNGGGLVAVGKAELSRPMCSAMLALNDGRGRSA